MSPDGSVPSNGNWPVAAGKSGLSNLARARRAQQEVIGVTLLTVVVATVALAVGAVVVAESTETDDGPTTDLVLDASADELTLSHNGGDPVALADLEVTLESDGTRTTFTPSVANATGPDDRLDPGERIRRDHGAAPGDLMVLVVHRPSSSVLLEDRITVP